MTAAARRKLGALGTSLDGLLKWLDGPEAAALCVHAAATALPPCCMVLCFYWPLLAAVCLPEDRRERPAWSSPHHRTHTCTHTHAPKHAPSAARQSAPGGASVPVRPLPITRRVLRCSALHAAGASRSASAGVISCTH